MRLGQCLKHRARDARYGIPRGKSGPGTCLLVLRMHQHLLFENDRPTASPGVAPRLLRLGPLVSLSNSHRQIRFAKPRNSPKRAGSHFREVIAVMRKNYKHVMGILESRLKENRRNRVPPQVI